MKTEVDQFNPPLSFVFGEERSMYSYDYHFRFINGLEV